MAGGDSGVLELWDTASDHAQGLDLRSDAALTAEFADVSDRTRGMILTTPTLDVEHNPPWTIHSLDVASDGTFAALGMANGMVLRDYDFIAHHSLGPNAPVSAARASVTLARAAHEKQPADIPSGSDCGIAGTAANEFARVSTLALPAWVADLEARGCAVYR